MKIKILKDSNNFLEFFPLKTNTLKPCFIVIPGGGYHHTSSREATTYVKKFQDIGFHVGILYYREAIEPAPRPMELLAKAINILKDNALKYNIDKYNINCIGFSAGAHLVLSLACHQKSLDYDCSIKAMVLSYPVITANDKYAHKGSFKNLFGGKESNLYDFYSLEKQIHHNMPKCFMWHTMEDASVHVYNSLSLALALKEHNCNLEYHVFNDGIHGMSLCTEETSGGEDKYINEHASIWFDLLIRWLKKEVI